MSLSILAAEGGYQSFSLGAGEWFWLVFSVAAALLAIAVGFALMRSVLAEDHGTPTMTAIAASIQVGAMAYLRRQFKTITLILAPLTVVVFVTSTAVVGPDGAEALGVFESGLFRTLAFLVLAAVPCPA